MRQTRKHARLGGSRYAGFTLVELLAVIGIIVVLISLLLPAFSHMRIVADTAATRNEIQQIAQACDNYFNDFRAYPGPFSNSDLESINFGGTPVTQLAFDPPTAASNNQYATNLVYISDTAEPAGGTKTLIPGVSATGAIGSAQVHYVTSSENLLLGLLGGLWISPSTSNTPGVVEFVNGVPTGSGITNVPSTLIGTGPRSLSAYGGNTFAGSGKTQYSAYLSATFPGSPMIMNGDGTPQTGPPVGGPYNIPSYHYITGNYFGDCVVPVFTDLYPSPMPILYIRARVGAHGIVSGPSAGPFPTYVTDPTLTGQLASSPTTAAHYNYDITELMPYTCYQFCTPNVGIGIPTGAGIVGQTPTQHGLQGVGDTNGTPLPYYPLTVAASAPSSGGKPTSNYPVPTNTQYNAGEYFMNGGIQPTSLQAIGTTDPSVAHAINATGTPRDQDKYILISAGPDRTYGTGDDVTSFGDVQP